jgi:hypothetical protein
MHSEGLTAGPPRPFAHTYDANGCAPLGEVSNGCCNGAVEGPVFQDNTCCYRFSVGGCCGRPLLRRGAAVVAPLIAGLTGWAAPG